MNIESIFIALAAAALLLGCKLFFAYLAKRAESKRVQEALERQEAARQRALPKSHDKLGRKKKHKTPKCHNAKRTRKGKKPRTRDYNDPQNKRIYSDVRVKNLYQQEPIKKYWWE